MEGFFRLKLGLVLAFAVALALGGCAGPRPVPGSGADAARLEAHVRVLSEEFRPRDHAHPEGLGQTADYIRAQARAAGGRVTEQRYRLGGLTWRNVRIRFGSRRGARIIVGAHYDAFGDLPGADDNASGVAGLLELARLLGRNPPAAPVELVAFALEEPPIFRTPGMGSVRHVAALKTRRVAVRAMLCLEMIGYFSDREDSQRFPLPGKVSAPASRGDFIAVVGDPASVDLNGQVTAAMRGATPLPVESLQAPRSVPGVECSDHFPYWDAGYPAVMITDTADNRNLAYHTAEDTADRLDYRRMAQVVRGVHAAVMELAR